MVPRPVHPGGMRRLRSAFPLARTHGRAYVREVSAPYPPSAPRREPAFNIPGVVAGLVLAMALIHGVRSYVLSDMQDIHVLALFAFIPARYGGTLEPFEFPGGIGADVWSFVTYALLHANFMHLAVNSVWLAAFGTPVARRFGTWRFLLFFAVTAAGGAIAHLLTHEGALLPMVGASASISGAMAAAVRFAFAPGGSLSGVRGPHADHQPAQPLLSALKDKRVLGFVGIWVALNLVFGMVSVPGSEDAEVAWQAHMGGFLAGLLLFPFFDPVPQARPAPSARL